MHSDFRYDSENFAMIEKFRYHSENSVIAKIEIFAMHNNFCYDSKNLD